MKPNGVLPEMYAVKPGPLKVPRTFCAPWPIITAASARRIGNVNQVAEVAMIRRNIFDLVFLYGLTRAGEDSNSYLARMAPLRSNIR